MSLPQVPEIFVGLRLRFCVFAILMETGWKSSKELLAAEGSAAHAETAHHLRLVSDADLPQLDARAERRGEVLDQLAEIHAALGGKEERILLPSNATSAETAASPACGPQSSAGRPQRHGFSFS